MIHGFLLAQSEPRNNLKTCIKIEPLETDVTGHNQPHDQQSSSYLKAESKE